MRRRSADNIHGNDNDNIFHYKVKVENQDLLLQLKPNYKLTSPNFVIERKKNRFKNVTDSTFRRLDESYSSCHYYGEIINQSDSRVALGVCNGLVSHIFFYLSHVETVLFYRVCTGLEKYLNIQDCLEKSLKI